MPTDATPLPEQLARLVVKDEVGLGGLPADAFQLALAWVWTGLPAGVVMPEPQVNQALKAQLAGPAVWLDTDHVELRRWLVDAGWLQRDGYGRAYQRTPEGAPGQALRVAALHALLQGSDTAAWTAAQRSAHAAARQARHQRWAAGQADGSSAGP